MQSKGAAGRIGRFGSETARDPIVFRLTVTSAPSRRRPGHLVCLLWSILCVPAVAWADRYSCEETGSVSIDPYQSAVTEEGGIENTHRRWLVDTDQGWHRAEFPGYRGSCQTENGYVICRTDNIKFGEATLSIHPNGTSFVVVYTDYGLGALAFVGKCRPLSAS